MKAVKIISSVVVLAFEVLYLMIVAVLFTAPIYVCLTISFFIVESFRVPEQSQPDTSVGLQSSGIDNSFYD